MDTTANLMTTLPNWVLESNLDVTLIYRDADLTRTIWLLEAGQGGYAGTVEFGEVYPALWNGA